MATTIENDCHILIDNELMGSPFLDDMLIHIIKAIKEKYPNIKYLNTMLFSDIDERFTVDIHTANITTKIYNTFPTNPSAKRSIHDILLTYDVCKYIFIITTNNIYTSHKTIDIMKYIKILNESQVSLFLLDDKPAVDNLPAKLLKSLADTAVIKID